MITKKLKRHTSKILLGIIGLLAVAQGVTYSLNKKDKQYRVVFFGLEAPIGVFMLKGLEKASDGTICGIESTMNLHTCVKFDKVLIQEIQ